MALLLLRTLPWRAYALAVALAAALVTLDPTVTMLRGSAVLLAATVALFCDDPAAAVTDATPTPRLVRRGLRLGVAAGAAFAAWFALVPFVAGVPVAGLAEELAVLLVVALAAGSALGGPAAAPVLLVTLMTAQHLSPHVSHLREAALVLGLATLAAALRDPAARRRRPAAPAGEPA